MVMCLSVQCMHVSGIHIVANENDFLSWNFLLSIFRIQVIFVDNSSLPQPFCDLVSFVSRTIEKHTFQPFLISICCPCCISLFYSRRHTEYELWLLFAAFLFARITTRMLKMKITRKNNVYDKKNQRKYCELYMSFIFYIFFLSLNKCSEPQNIPTFRINMRILFLSLA